MSLKNMDFTEGSQEEGLQMETQLDEIRKMIEANAPRVAQLGQWPSWTEPGSLLERLPKKSDDKAPGFDAGIASSLDLIPSDKQELSARLHVAYTKDAVIQVREEAKDLSPDSQTAWWLAACSLCKEGEINGPQFLQQVADFKKLSADEGARKIAAENEFATMMHSFRLENGVPYGEKDGCIQGAYLVGFPYGVQHASNYGLYFIGTYEDSLGLEDFAWSTETDEKGRAKSGPVFGSKQFVKCATEEELWRAVEVIKAKLPIKKE